MMVTIFRLVVLLMILVATGACQSTKAGPAMVLEPGSPGLEQLYQEGRAAYLAEDYQAAATTFARVVEIDPTHLNALINWGASLSRGGNPREAIPKFEQALARDPNHAWAMYNLGVALQRLGEHEAAVTQYKLAVARDSSLLTPGMKRYMQRREPKQQETEINFREPTPSLKSR
jgi:tetratricopeptide (TPR) repeat protein